MSGLVSKQPHHRVQYCYGRKHIDVVEKFHSPFHHSSSIFSQAIKDTLHMSPGLSVRWSESVASQVTFCK